MKGTNTFRFNMMTVREAMEEYLNRRLLATAQVTVSDVGMDNDNSGLVVEVVEPKAKR